MTAPKLAEPSNAIPGDDAVVVFRTDASRVLGRLVRLGPVADKIICAHALPAVASTCLGEALATSAMLGSVVPDGGGTLSVQTKTDGAIQTIYADCQAPGRLRGYVRADFARLQSIDLHGAGDLLGAGHLAVTHDPGAASDRYQGVIAIDSVPLAEGVQSFFSDRENLPTFVRLAAAEHDAGGNAALPAGKRWRAGGLMLQAGTGLETASSLEDWSRVCMLAATLEDHELLDPVVSAEQLLLRLFHEEGVRIQKIIPLQAYCKCSRGRVLNVLKTFGPAELMDMRDARGKIAATCEFCAETYAFEMAEIATPPEGGVQ